MQRLSEFFMTSFLPVNQPWLTARQLEKQTDSINDGSWYFHAQLKNSKGWGAISNFRFQIDTQPPDPFSIKFIDGNQTDNPRPPVSFLATDSLSGVDHYRIKIGEGDFFVVSADTIAKGPYALPLQDPGERTIIVQAYDKAGNYTTASDEFTVLSIEPPVITEYPSQLRSDDILTVKGTTYPNIQVIVWLQRDGEEAQSQTIKSDRNGKFTFVAQANLQGGVYKLWAQAIDDRGAKSNFSDSVTIAVEQPAFLRLGSLVINFLAVLVPIIVLIGFLVFFIWYGWHKFLKLKKEVRKEVHEVEVSLNKAFDFLREEIRTHIRALEKTQTKRQLTEEEEKLFIRLKKDLDNSEKLLRKEIEDVGKEE